MQHHVVIVFDVGLVRFCTKACALDRCIFGHVDNTIPAVSPFVKRRLFICSVPKFALLLLESYSH